MADPKPPTPPEPDKKLAAKITLSSLKKALKISQGSGKKLY